MGQRHANTITTPPRHPAQSKRIGITQWCFSQKEGKEWDNITPIKFPSVEAVNSQHKQGQEEFDNKVLWLCRSSGVEVVNEKLREEMQP